MGARTWIKIYCKKWLQGTIRQESILVRSVWIDLLVLAGSSAYSEAGVIGISGMGNISSADSATKTVPIAPMVGISDAQFSKILGVSRQAWVSAKQRLIDTKRIIVTKENVIIIINWNKYQSEYERIKSTTKHTAKSTSIDVRSRYKMLDVEKSTPINPKHGLPVQREPEYFCKICSDQANKPINHKYSEIKRGTCKPINDTGVDEPDA